MSKSIKQSQKNIARETTSSHILKGKIFSYSGENRINLIKNRWLYIKTQEIVSDLTQILIFTKKLEKSLSKNLDLCDQVSALLSKLEGRKRDSQYMKIVQVITKYLEGIRKFISNTEIKGVLFYKTLFESTIIAIRRELDYIENEVY